MPWSQGAPHQATTFWRCCVDGFRFTFLLLRRGEGGGGGCFSELSDTGRLVKRGVVGGHAGNKHFLVFKA